LAPQEPSNDGKETPFRGHPVFMPQHATATCCRGCLAKWHDISGGRMLDQHERSHVLAVPARWLKTEAPRYQVRKVGGLLPTISVDNVVDNRE
jgi:hypothetical protein